MSINYFHHTRWTAVVLFLMLLSIDSQAQRSSACYENDPSKGCKGAFAGMRVQTTPGIYTVFNVPAVDGVYPPTEVSGVDIHTLLSSGNSSYLFAHFLPWFAVEPGSVGPYPRLDPNSGSQELYKTYAGHVETGYDSNQTATVVTQMADMRRRGFNGLVIDWYGPNAKSGGPNPSVEEATTGYVRDELLRTYCGTSPCSLLMALMEDQGSWQRAYPDLGGCATGAGSDQGNCVIGHNQRDLSYIDTNYTHTAPYLRAIGNAITQMGVGQ